MPDDVTSWVPDSCTLPTADQPLRVAKFDDLFATSAVGAVRTAATRLRVHLKGSEDLLDRVRDLADRESACCTFFTFDITVGAGGGVTLDVEVDPTHVPVLDAIAARVDLDPPAAI